MSNAIAVIQPSLFEGWSTVVEDAKAMNQVIIASDIAVHKEQLNGMGHFFSPNNPFELKDLLVLAWNNKLHPYSEVYMENIRQFGLNFLNIVKQISS